MICAHGEELWDVHRPYARVPYYDGPKPLQGQGGRPRLGKDEDRQKSEDKGRSSSGQLTWLYSIPSARSVTITCAKLWSATLLAELCRVVPDPFEPRFSIHSTSETLACSQISLQGVIHSLHDVLHSTML